MLFASRSNFDAETALRRLEDRVNTLDTNLSLLQELTDTRIVNLQSEWRTHLAEVADVHDKMDHIVKRHGKRRAREKPTEGDPEVGPEEMPKPSPDPVTERVLARRNRDGIRSENVQG